MTNNSDITKYDEVLTSILVNEKSILGFLSAIFNFLARRTDFYHVPEGPYENMGFPPGVAEEIVIKVLRTCDPKNWKGPNGATKPTDFSNEIMCSTVAQEVEVIANEDIEETEITQTSEALATENIGNKTDSEELNYSEIIKNSNNPVATQSNIENQRVKEETKIIPDDYKPPVIPTQKNSETYNGAEREKYLWSQTIMELDAIVKLPPGIKSSKDIKVTINAGDICVAQRTGDIIIKDSLPYKIKTIDSFWSVSEGKLAIHLEKVQERWWNRFLNSEEPIDLHKIDCSRPLDELPEDHIAKVRELQWNQERKMQGLPTSDEIRNIDILKKAWDAPGSPFKGQKFDPSILNTSNTFPSFSGEK